MAQVKASDDAQPPPPADDLDPVIEAYKKDVDRTLLRENLKLTPEERVRKAQSIRDSVERVRGAARPAPRPRTEGDRT